MIHDEDDGVLQSAYQVQAAGSVEALKQTAIDRWDSGKCKSRRNTGIAYGGHSLRSGERVFWRVRVWDQQDRFSAWSAPTWFEMGLLSPADWCSKDGTAASWIGHLLPEQLPERPVLGDWIWQQNQQFCSKRHILVFRRSFDIPELPAEAWLSIAAPGRRGGACSVWINGRSVMNYPAAGRIDWVPVEFALVHGLNEITMEVSGPSDTNAVAARLVLKFADNEVCIDTDEHWEVNCSTLVGEGNRQKINKASQGPYQPVKVVAPWGDASLPAYQTRPEPDPALYLRRDFLLTSRPVAARLFICGLGYFEATVNGRPVTDAVLQPGQRDADLIASYLTYDITPQLHKGCNRIGVILGNGWYHQNIVWEGMDYGVPGLLCRIAVACEDGSQHVICSDDKWQATTGALGSHNIHSGEFYDGRCIMDGWDDPFKAEPPELRWKAADILPPRVPSVRSEGIPPMRRAQRYPLQTIHRSQDAWIADFGQNLAGWAELALEEPEGTVVNLRFAEALTPDGRLDPGSSGQAVTHVAQEDRYVCAGMSEERYHPRFTYHGFRYVEVRGLSNAPTAAQLSAVAVHSNLPEVGTFRCSHADINALYGLLSKTLTSNYLSVPTDCPARERGAWTGDAHVMASTMLYCHDTVAFLEKFVDDMIVSMQLNGKGIPGHIVAGRRSRAGKNADWVLAMVLVPWQIYLHTADPYIIEHSFDAMVTTVRTLAAGQQNGLIVTGFGDHRPPDGNSGNPHRPPIHVTSTAYFIHAVDCLQAMAAVVERSSEIEDIVSGTEIIRKGFHELLDEKGSYGTQTANALALAFGLGPADATKRLRHHLLTDFEDGTGRFRTGILGNGPLYRALTQAGAGQRVMDILLRPEHPGFLGTMRDGATTLRESILPNTPDGWGPMFSRNHPMHGAYGAWLYESLGGIAVDPKQPGFESVRMQPHFDPRLDWVQASHRTPCGVVFSHWRRNDNGMCWDISLPPNVRAEVILPRGRTSSVRIATPGHSESRRPDNAGNIRLDPGFHTLTWSLANERSPR